MAMSVLLAGCAPKEVVNEVTRVVTEKVVETVMVEGTPQVVEREVTRVVEVEKVVTPTIELAPPQKKTLIYVYPQEVRWLDPAKITEGMSGTVARNVYSRLLDRSYDGYQTFPDLAETWEVSDDGLTYTFHLRAGVKFHDDTPLTAADVVYSFQRALAINLGDVPFVIGKLSPDSVVALDDLTVQMTLSEAWSAFPTIIAGPFSFSILPRAWVEANATAADPWAEEYLKDHANGTGPFEFVEWVPQQYVRMVRYDEYWKGPAKIEEVLYQLSPDDTTSRLALEKGDVDVVMILPDDMMTVLKQNPNIHVYTKPVASYMYWIFDTSAAPFNDKRVRQAFAYALDYDSMMENLVKDGGTRMNSPLMSGMFGHNPKLPLIQRDVEKAKQLLAEAGYPAGFAMDMPYVVWGLIPDLAVVIQANLADIGVQARLQEITLNALMGGVEDGSLPFFVWNSSPVYPHPDAMFQKLISANMGMGLEGNLASYSNPELDAAVEQARVAVSEEDQLAAYYRAQEIVMDDMPWLLLYEESQSRATGSWVIGYDFGSFNRDNFWNLDIQR
jgi:peptide/nickel transport system substrate-binding protein